MFLLFELIRSRLITEERRPARREQVLDAASAAAGHAVAFREHRRYACLHHAAGEVPVITGPEEGAAAGHGSLRASHADREHVIDTLKTAFADGRLDQDELDGRVGQTLAARTYAELAAVTADIPVGSAPAPPPRRAARPPVNKEAVKWSLVAAGAMIPPAMFVAAAFGPFILLAFLAMPLLFIELIVAIIFVTVTLANQHKDRSRSSRGQLPARPGQPGRRAESERHGSPGHEPSPHRTRPGQTRPEQTRADRPLVVPAPEEVPAGQWPAVLTASGYRADIVMKSRAQCGWKNVHGPCAVSDSSLLPLAGAAGAPGGGS